MKPDPSIPVAGRQLAGTDTTVAPSSAAVWLDRDSPLPLYAQIKRRVLAMILAWQQESTRFHTDQELAEQFGVSRMTVRQAVQELVAEGYLRRVRGSGTFVCAPKVDEHFRPEMDFADQWSASGRPLTLSVLQCLIMPAGLAVARSLQIQAGEPVWSVLRLRSVQHVPISLDYRFIPQSRLPRLVPSQVEAGSLLRLVSRETGGLAYGEFKIEAAPVSADDADYLNLLPADPVLTRHLLYFDSQNRPAMSGVSHYRADQVRYSVRVPLDTGADQAEALTETLEIRERP